MADFDDAIIYNINIGIQYILDDLNFRRWARDPDKIPHQYSFYDLQALRWGRFSGFDRHDKWIEFIGVDLHVLDFVTQIVEPWMNINERELKAIPLRKRICIALFHLRHGCSCVVTSYIFGCSKSIVAVIFNEFIKCVSQKIFIQQFITFPNINEAISLSEESRLYGGLPGAILAIDGTEIPFCAPKHSLAYMNYKKFNSVKLTCACDYKLRARFIDVGTPGRMNDAQAYLQCSFEDAMKQLNDVGTYSSFNGDLYGLDVPFFAVGDGIYGCTKYLVAPYTTRGRNIIQPYQRPFNVKQRRTRNKIERFYGVLTGRWRKLKIPQKLSKINMDRYITTCVILHNICVEFGTPNIDLELEEPIEVEGHPAGNDLLDGKLLREALTQYVIDTL